MPERERKLHSRMRNYTEKKSHFVNGENRYVYHWLIVWGKKVSCNYLADSICAFEVKVRMLVARFAFGLGYLFAEKQRQ